MSGGNGVGELGAVYELPIARRHLETTTPCALCGQGATIVDWRPSGEWAMVQGCDCGWFFMRAALLDGRLAAIPVKERAALRGRIAALRARRRGAWLVTADGRPDGRLIVQAERPR